jgi:bacterial nucleoid DNA-binding protein
MSTISTKEIYAQVAEKAGKSQATVKATIDALLDTIAENVSQDNKVQLVGWLTVERTERAARTGRNPQTGEAIQIPAGYGVKVAAGSKLKDAVKK